MKHTMLLTVIGLLLVGALLIAENSELEKQIGNIKCLTENFYSDPAKTEKAFLSLYEKTESPAGKSLILLNIIKLYADGQKPQKIGKYCKIALNNSYDVIDEIYGILLGGKSARLQAAENDNLAFIYR